MSTCYRQLQSLISSFLECQKVDWKEHKSTCKSLKGATWTPITFRFLELPNGAVPLLINRRTPLGRTEGTGPTGKEPPHNTHGMQPFLVKVQCNTGDILAGDILIYDRRRTFDAIFARADGAEVFDQVVQKILREGGIAKPKLYFWARRTGEWELSLATNRLPDQNVKW